MKKEDIKKIKVKYEKNKFVNKEQLIEYIIEEFDEDTKNKKYIMNSLYEENIFYKYNSNILKLTNKRYKFNPSYSLDNDIKDIVSGYEDKVLAWNMSSMNSLISLQLMKEYIIVEVPYFMEEHMFEILRKKYNNVSLLSEFDIASKYFDENKTFIIKKYYENESPIEKEKYNNKLFYKPKLEKILVDVCTDEFYQTIFSSELPNIFRNALKEYQINMSTLKRYAIKRKKWERIKDFLNYLEFDIESGEFR